ncbi:MAG: leucine-rich repeat domain-containing protein, partial [Muribaculaceae bacterium]|nr:leucine-rich repeat domain-containing protein [Muribaculaceae bacterium]
MKQKLLFLLLGLISTFQAIAWTSVRTEIDGVTYEATNSNGSTVIRVDPSLESVNILSSYNYEYNGKTYTSTVKWLDFESSNIKEISVSDEVDVKTFLKKDKTPNLTEVEVRKESSFSIGSIWIKYSNNWLNLSTDRKGLLSSIIRVNPVLIPETVTLIIGFNDCKELSSVVIPNSVTSIGNYAFSGCINLRSVVIPNSVTKIGKEAFYDCSGLTSMVIPNSVTSIGKDAFKNCYLKKAAYPNTIANPFCSDERTYISDYDPETAFAEDGWIWDSEKSAVYFAPANLEGEYTLPESVILIGESAFDSCNYLTSIKMGNSVKEISDYAFYNCTGLGSVELPNSVTKIGKEAFYNCTRLDSVELPNSVKEIGEYAFFGSGLSSLIYNAKNCNIKGPFPDSLESLVIGDEVEKIPAQSFTECKKLLSVVIPNSVTEIGENAFNGCIALTSVEIGNSVQAIGNFAFSGCSGLASVVIPNSVTYIGDAAFWNSGLISLTFNAENCTSCGTEYIVFPNSIDTLVIGDKVNIIPQFSFYNLANLTSVEIPNSVTSIGGRAFYGCSGLTSLEIGESVTTIGNNAFEG